MTLHRRYQFPNGLPFDAISYSAAVDRIVEFAHRSGSRGAVVCTPNVHHYCLYDKNALFRAAYESADLILLDGMPLVWAAKAFFGLKTDKVSGSDVFVDVLKRVVADGLRVFLLGAAPGVAELAVKTMGLESALGSQVFCFSPPVGFDAQEEGSRVVIELVAGKRPDVLFVALGAPRQELWLHRYRESLSAGVSLAVGGSFDFAAGTVPRAPFWMQRTSLEWLFRLVREPRRLWRRYIETNTYFLTQMAFMLIRKVVGLTPSHGREF
jgi:N-acetylglucosaminyldiphosphoundecaprenol N-acetyl-beta-D-mannosaminyltransferase